MRTKAWIAAAAATVSVVVAAPATAATVTVTGDDGNPATLAPGVPASIRNMDVDLAVALSGTDKAVAVSVAGPVAPAASPRTCSTIGATLPIDYQGNGTYTATVTTYTDTSCKVGAKPATYSFSVNASTALTPPGGVLLTRQPNSFSTIEYQIPIAFNPGALTHEIFMAAGGVIAPDGSISGASKQLFANTATGTVSARFDAPGDYVLVARAKAFSGGAGQFYSPWSAPITARVLAPFDLVGNPTLPDNRGPRYKLRGTVREKLATGKVKLAVARGKKGGKFRSIGKARIRRGTFKKSFRLHRPGQYRVRFSYKGNKAVAPGAVTHRFTIVRRAF
jgi:hypothetical protein